MDNINVTVKSKTPAVETKSLKELTAEVAEVKSTIVDINASVEQAEQDVERLNEAYNNSDDFIIGPGNKMKRKPKAYAPAEYSGLGEIYLDKNMKFLGREFEEFVSNPNVPHPGESIGDPDGIVYDRVRQAFLGYRNFEGSRIYTDTWDEQADYTAASGYKYLCTSTDTAYKWQNGDLVETAAINGNVLTQAMLEFEHTIYHIQYDYDLNGRTIEVPDDCTLYFEGGSLNNGEINGWNTVIKTELVQIFGTELTTTGKWCINEVYPEWFGAKGDNSTDDTDAIQRAVEFNAPTVFNRKIYCISGTVDIPDAKIIKSFTEEVTYDLSLEDEDSHLQAGYIKAIDSMDAMFHIKGQSVNIENIALIGNGKANYGIYSTPTDRNITRVNLNNVYVYNILVACYYITCYNLVLNRCNANGNHIENSYGFIIGNVANGNPHIIMDMCYARNCAVGYSIRNTSYITINAPGCDDCTIAYDFFNINQGEVISLGAELFDTAIRLRGFIKYLKFEGLAVTPNTNANIFDVDIASADDYRSSYVSVRNLFLDSYIRFNNINSVIHGTSGIHLIIFDVDDSVNKFLCDGNLKEIHRNLFTPNISQTAEVDPDQSGVVNIVGKTNGAITIKKIDPNTPFARTLPVHLGSMLLKRGVYRYEYFPIGEGQVASYELSISKSKWNSNEITKSSRNALASNILTLYADTLVYFGLRFFKDAYFHSTLITPLIYKIADIQTKESGTFATKPSSDTIGVGYKYFCTDRQSPEQAAIDPSVYGIEIIYKGSDVWVDALGRTVS